ncbi:similar to Saccharomyces cerevisiae YCR090C Putative protein of unknown function [Maudiozyma barnettii]|uniref:Uncharacterized protein n=1 Tax=Maudiozyma barnettii TaxID=61262 RepID=A0A8H2VBP8_9SACH|nr:hypothetical protein [Kazachstania barnettii]CAB4252321.1 similar to Saccharomyces cerevisiae YCR090C Putative protein of unknown function [Kazachstania barnettii]CAD1779055.1 similar to Saccharomyces cerevisiae YCR090C Putative protein of unknown function [Kazachstania barnettii]
MLYLFMCAELSDNIKKLYVDDTDVNPVEYSFKFKCTKCGEDAEKINNFNLHEKHEIQGGKGEATFIMKCKFCESDNTVLANTFEPCLFAQQEEHSDNDKRKKYGLNGNKIDINNYAAIMQLDSRGWAINDFLYTALPFKVELNSGKIMDCQFEDDGSWYDYDDESSEEVYITDFKYKIEKGK